MDKQNITERGNIRVAVRVRPLLDQEVEGGHTCDLLETPSDTEVGYMALENNSFNSLARS